uniref:Uncharacterized protein n=1 Tax=Arundo donax TaxID=35708 RepID=A0A0A9G240_ARUDO
MLVPVNHSKSQVGQMFQVETQTPTKMIKVHCTEGPCHGETWILNPQLIMTDNFLMMVTKCALKPARRKSLRNRDTRLLKLQPIPLGQLL